MRYTWDESMSTGVSRLDAQHKMLINKFNELSELVETQSDLRAAASEALDFLQFYAAWHFKHEEECMEKYQCPVAADNKQAHKEFLRQFGELYERWQNGTMSQQTAQETYNRLAEWIMKHIINTDTRLKPCAPKQ